MSIEFPLVNKRTSFGIIPDSLIPVEVLTKFGYQSLEFVLDTGADFPMLPHHMAEVIEIDLSACPQSRSYIFLAGQTSSPDLTLSSTTEIRKSN